MKICNLGSGSKGNATFIEHDDFKVLIDAGLSYQELSRRLELLGTRPEEINAIIVSHEHIDHVKAVDAFSVRHSTKIYAHVDCFPSLIVKQPKIKQTQKNVFYDMDFQVGPFIFTPIRVPHDSSCCHGFCVSTGSKKFSILTDLGQTNDKILSCVKDSQLLFLEANHDESLLLANMNYPLILKKRIMSCKGHLSNTACAKAIVQMYNGTTKQIVLAHLSEQNNNPELAYNTVSSILRDNGLIEGQNIFIDVASQTRPGVIFKLN